MIDDIKDALFFVFVGVGMFLAVLTCILPLIYFAENSWCSNFEQVSGQNTNYSLFGGCLIKTDNGWYSKEQYQAALTAKEAVK